MNKGSVNNSYATEIVIGNWNVGGLIGENKGSVINSYVIGSVTSRSGYVGGLIGRHYDDTVKNCYASGSVSGGNYTGGLVGKNRHLVLSSYATGKVTGDRYIGGFVGSDMGAANGFWDTNTSGITSSDGGTGQKTEEMKMKSTFTEFSWNFTTTWDIIENITYPFLKWQVIKFPIANAGLDQTLEEDTIARFDGSLSTDGLGISNYTWTFTNDGSLVTLYGVGPSYQFNVPGVYVVTLNVTDLIGSWDTDPMNVIVKDTTYPIADAGPNQTIDEDNIVVFNGSNSSDNVGIENYTWAFSDGIHVILNGIRASYQFKEPGVYTVILNVTDLAGNWDTDTLSMTVYDVTGPVADADPDQTVDEDTDVAFDGSNSFDNVGITSYTWTFADNDILVNLSGLGPTYEFTNPGEYLVTLNVSDSSDNWDTDIMIVTVNDVTAPTADVGSDQTVDEDTIVSFDGSNSSDNVGIANFTWTFTQNGSLVALYGSSPSYEFSSPGVYRVTLNVTDPEGNWNTSTMRVTVIDVTAPTADAGLDQTVDEDTIVSFDGRNSSDNVGIANFTWTFTDKVNVTLHGPTPSYELTSPGEYRVTLIVTDTAGNSDSDVMRVRVQPLGTDDDGGSTFHWMNFFLILGATLVVLMCIIMVKKRKKSKGVSQGEQTQQSTANPSLQPPIQDTESQYPQRSEIELRPEIETWQCPQCGKNVEFQYLYCLNCAYKNT